MDNNLEVTGTASVTSTSTLKGTVKIGGGGAGYVNAGSGFTVTDQGVMSMNGALLVASTTTITGESKHTGGLKTGDGHLSGGATLSSGGALSMDSSLKVTGTVNFPNSVTLAGNVGETIQVGAGYGNNGLTITQAGAICMDQFLKVDGAISANAKTHLNGAVDLGSVKGDAILINGDLTVSSSQNPDIDFRASASGSCYFACAGR